MGVATWIDKANGRLKGCKIKLHVPKGSDRIYLRGTFPAQPWEEDQRRRQRKISTGRRVMSEADVKVAEKLARQIDVDLNNGEFDWAGFGKEDPNPESESTTLAHWVRVFAESKQREIEPLTWERNYEVVMRSLPLDKELSESILIDWILTQNPTGNTMRAKYIAIALGLCDVAGIPPGNIPKLRKGISNKPINVRNLPEPEAIEKIFLSIEKREWRWVFGMIATYGLRPHEIFRLDLSEFPDVKVLENSKTGARSITPLRPGWVDLFGLTAEIKIPDNIQWSPGLPNTRLGRKITNGYRRYGLGDAYDYRHCFARDCLVMGLSSDVSAKLMGHSREVHEKTYRRHIKAGVYLDAAKAAIAKARRL